MKRYILLLFAIGITAMSSVCMAALSSSGVRRETRFLTDKMAYELNLNNSQYNDIYEINYDFIYNINRTMDYAVKGYSWAMEDYYDALDMRNDELRWVLSNSQYRRFMKLDYFYRPIFVARNNWSFRVYNIYVNRSKYYYPKPYHYSSYNGANRRNNYNRNSYYKNRHNHDSFFGGSHKVRDDRSYQNYRRSDFGSVSVKPNSSSRPTNMKPIINTGSNSRPSNNNNVSTRPGSNSNSNSNNSSRPSSNSGTSRPSKNDDKTHSNSNSSSRPSTNSGTSRPTTNQSQSGSSTSRPSTDRNSHSNSNRQNGTTARPTTSTKTESSSSNRRGESTSTRSSSSNTKRSTKQSSDDSKKTDNEKRSSSRRQ